MTRINDRHTLLPVSINMLRTMVQHREGSTVLMKNAKKFANFMIHELRKIGINYNPYNMNGTIKPLQTMVGEFTNVFALNKVMGS